jgi:glycosyltransferase involved in cell wall biosynthesis
MFSNDNIKTVLVLLSTYNGEKYLEEQLDSLYRQNGIKLHILIRDDGSSDSTVKKINEYALRYDNTSVLIENNIGCALSFNRLVEYAYTTLQKYDYYAFCDQDDVWDDDKLFCAVDYLEKHKENPLQLYTSAYRVVDDKLNFKYTQRFKYKHTLGEALITLNTMGCTQVFSRALLEQSLKRIIVKASNMVGMPNHDGWLYLVAIVNNAYMCYDEKPHINYRQHGFNVVGAYQASFINRVKRTVKGKNLRSGISKILFETFDNSDEHNKQLLSLNFTYMKSFRSKLKLLFSKEMMTKSIPVNIAYRILILLNYY